MTRTQRTIRRRRRRHAELVAEGRARVAAQGAVRILEPADVVRVGVEREYMSASRRRYIPGGDRPRLAESALWRRS